jgi:hypothetical protein
VTGIITVQDTDGIPVVDAIVIVTNNVDIYRQGITDANGAWDTTIPEGPLPWGDYAVLILDVEGSWSWDGQSDLLITILPPPPPPPPSGRITAWRVRDIATGIWYNWDNGSWSTPPPICTPGVGMLYVAVWVVALGDVTLTLRLIEVDTGRVLAEKSGYVLNGSGIDLVWTGDMPMRNYSLTCTVLP